MDVLALTRLLETNRREALRQFEAVVGARLDANALETLFTLAKDLPYRWSGLGPSPHDGLEHRTLPFLLGQLLRVTRGADEAVWERVDDRGAFTHVLVARFERDGRWFVTVGVRWTGSSRWMGEEWVEFQHWRPRSSLTDNREALLEWARHEGPDRRHPSWGRSFTPPVSRVTLELVAPPRASPVNADDEASFLRAIAAQPEDDAPRLVYADWLTERGDARGELIQLQLEKKPSAALVAKTAALLTSRWKEFAGPLAKWVKGPQDFERGLVKRVRLNAAQLEREGARLFTSFPLTELVFAEPDFTSAMLERLARAEALDLVRELTIYEMVGTRAPPRGVAALSKGTRFASLRRLNLRVRGKSGADWKALFSKLAAPRLEHVDLRYVSSHHGIYEALVASKKLSALKQVTESVEAPMKGLDEEVLARAIAKLERRGVRVTRTS